MKRGTALRMYTDEINKFVWLTVASPFADDEFQLVLIAGSINSGWLIPGYFLKLKFKKEN